MKAATVPNRVRRSVKRVPRRSLLSLTFAVLACAAIYLIEHVLESRLNSEKHGQSPLTRSIFELSGVYQGIVTVGWRKPQPRFTVIVELNPEGDPRLAPVSLYNICDQRAFLADLIDNIASNSPAVIVLDKYFGRDTCDRRPDGTAALQRVIENVSRRIPIVVGLYAFYADGSKHSQTDVHVEPSLMLSGPHVVQGIVNIDPDTRRMALRWCGRLDGKAEMTMPEWCETLALKAARQYEPLILRKYPGLRKLLETDTRPYISFLRPEQFCQFSYGSLLGDGGQPGPVSSCPVLNTGRADLGYMRGKVVIVGERSREMDTHLSVVGPVSGLFMQANYVEALLDDRYFEPLPLLDYIFGILLFAGVTIRVWWPGVPRGMTSAVTYGVFPLVAGMVLVLVLLGGFYVNPVGVGILAVMFEGSHRALSWLRKRLAKRELLRRAKN